MDPISKLNAVGKAVREKEAKPALTIQIGQGKPEAEQEQECCPNCGCPLEPKEGMPQEEASPSEEQE
jgi:hypothetical protein